MLHVEERSVALYFESENELKFYNLEIRESLETVSSVL